MASTRRGFIGSATALAATAGTLATPKAAPARKTDGLFRIGVVTCHPSHHHIPNIWGPLIQCVQISNKYTPTRMTGMMLTHIWDLDPARMDSFNERFGTVSVKNYDDMVGLVDGVIISDVRNADHFPELCEPYLKAGIPVLFNRPFTTSVGRVKRIIDSSKRYGTPFMTASGWEYCKEVYAMRRKVAEWGPNIRAAAAENSSYEVTHDVHGVWILCAMLGVGIESVSVSRPIRSIYEHSSDTWTIQFKGRNGGEPFYATLHNTSDHDTNCWVKVILDKGTFEQSLWNLDSTESRYQYYFLPPLLEFQRMIERGTMPQSHEHVLEKSAAFIAGFKSHLEMNGAPVRLAELEDDYRVPSDKNVIEYPAGFFK